MRLEINKTRTEKSDHLSRSVLGHIFLHPNNSGQVRVGHKPDLWTPLPGIDNAKSKLKKLGTNLRESTTSKDKEKIFGGTY